MPKWLVFCLTLQTALARFPHQRIRCHLPPQGGKLPPIFACSRSQEYSAVTQTTDLSCKYDKSGLIVWLIHCESDLQLSVLFKQGFKPELLLFSLFFCASKACMPFLSPRKLISHPDTQTWPFYPLFSFFLFFFLLKAGNEHKRFCAALWWGLRPPTPPGDSTWCWEMRRETGVTHDLQCSNTTGLTIRGAPRKGGGGCWPPCEPLYNRSPSHWQILGNPTLPRLSSKIMSITVDERSGLCV